MYILAFHNISTFIITGAIPFLLLFIFNGKIYVTLKQATEAQQNLNVHHSNILGNRWKEKVRDDRGRKNERLQSMVLFGIIISFFTCHILRVILNLEEIIYFEEINQLEIMEKKHGIKCTHVQFWTAITADISHLLLQVSSSINFFIYGWLSKKFRKAIKEKLICCRTTEHVSPDSSQMTLPLTRIANSVDYCTSIAEAAITTSPNI